MHYSTARATITITGVNDLPVAVDDTNTTDVGGLYLAGPEYDTKALRSGTSDQLLEQAVAWAGGGEDTGGMQLTDFAADLIL